MPYSGMTRDTSLGGMQFQCNNCGYWHETETTATECCPQYGCSYCGNRYVTPHEAEDCHPEWECEECGNYTRDPDHECGYPDGYDGPKYPRDKILAIKPKVMLYVTSIEGRPARVCSVEQELSSGAQVVAKMLYDSEVSPYDRMMSYSQDVDPRYAIVKSDSSLPHGGGEIVYSRFDLSRSQDVRRLSTALVRVRAMKDEKLVTTTTAAGTHVHISATDVNGGTIFGPKQMAALYEIFSYCEEVLFLLATAGWQSHRDAGAEFAKALRKYEKVSAGKIARSFSHHDHRYFSLNFLRLLEAARRCSCGACISGDWEDCECGVLKTGTIEWRVFNATTKPETMYAWVLLAHGVTAASFQHELGTLEPNAWQATDREKHQEIFEWILSKCPFTDAERQVIVSCARRVNDLHVDWGAFERSFPEWAQETTPVELDPEEDVVAEEPPSNSWATSTSVFQDALNNNSYSWIQAQPGSISEPVELEVDYPDDDDPAF